jgi:hypothetical protein
MSRYDDSIHTRRLGQRLAIAVALSLTLLMIGVVGLVLAIRHGVVVPPEVKNRLNLDTRTAPPPRLTGALLLLFKPHAPPSVAPRRPFTIKGQRPRTPVL